jgi:hypothetical protein
MDYHVFNGDADGLCAVHQWRLAHPAVAHLVTGVKRDVTLLDRVHALPGDSVTMFDIALRDNRAAAERLMREGASVTYFDHHEAGEGGPLPGAQLHLDPSPDVCTSLLVDRELGGAYRAWAVTAAFGDNLDASARRAAMPLNLIGAELAALAELGRLLNYNAYGDEVADLHYPPEALYRAMAPYRDPLAFWRAAGEVQVLRKAFAADWARAERIAPLRSSAGSVAYLLPAEPWARRMHGPFANRMTERDPDRAVAVLAAHPDGTLRISVRAPRSRATGADRLCRSFPSGGGRGAAAGISSLPTGQLDEFLARFEAAFSRREA